MLTSYLLKNDKRLEAFFSSLDRKKSYLLGFSGGSDSLFLFYVLKSLKIKFTAVHVDHGWRECSREEAKALKEFCHREKISYIGHRLSPEEKGERDLENAARKARYAFFYQLCVQQNFSGVFLAHHANDQAETLLKRVLEGAHLSNLKGMTVSSFYQGMQLLRPLLHIPKARLMSLLHREKISYISDETNEDERYLRARMRKKLFPWLEEVFGKNVSSPLFALAEESKELAEYMESQTEPFLSKVTCQQGGQVLPISKGLIQQPFLAKYVCKKFFGMFGISVTRHFLQMVYEHLCRRSSVVLCLRNKSVIVKPDLVMIQ